MGKVIAKAMIWNFGDEILVSKGLLKAEEIRRVEVDGRVDSVLGPRPESPDMPLIDLL